MPAHALECAQFTARLNSELYRGMHRRASRSICNEVCKDSGSDLVVGAFVAVDWPLSPMSGVARGDSFVETPPGFWLNVLIFVVSSSTANAGPNIVC